MLGVRKGMEGDVVVEERRWVSQRWRGGGVEVAPGSESRVEQPHEK